MHVLYLVGYKKRIERFFLVLTYTYSSESYTCSLSKNNFWYFADLYYEHWDNTLYFFIGV